MFRRSRIHLPGTGGQAQVAGEPVVQLQLRELAARNVEVAGREEDDNARIRADQVALI